MFHLIFVIKRSNTKFFFLHVGHIEIAKQMRMGIHEGYSFWTEYNSIRLYFTILQMNINIHLCCVGEQLVNECISGMFDTLSPRAHLKHMECIQEGQETQ